MSELQHPIPKRKGTALLFSEHPIVIDPLLAALLGLHEAIILQQLHYWLRNNEKKGENIRDGRVWVYLSYKEWREQIPFFSPDQIKRAFLSLEKKKVVISRQFDRKDWNRRKWYSIDYLVLNDVQLLDFSDGANLHHREGKNPPSNVQQRPIECAPAHDQNQITETTSETKAETTTTAVAVDHLIEKLPRELTFDAEVRSWIADSLATHGEDYTISNITATVAQAKSSPKAFLRKALLEDYGELYRAKRRAAEEKAMQAAQTGNRQKEKGEAEALKLQKARMIFESLPESEREGILAEARRRFPVSIPQMVEAAAIEIAMDNYCIPAMLPGDVSHRKEQMR